MLGYNCRNSSLRVKLTRKDGQPQRQSAGAGAPRTGITKTIHVMRHGQTEMNVYLSREDPDDRRESSPSFKDPLLFDTKLTAQGEIGAREAGTAAKALDPPPDIVISSPLTRALHTADLAFAGIPSPRLVLSLARERTYFASDVGVKRSELLEKWPGWSFEGVRDEIWWLDHCDDQNNPFAIIKEPEEHFTARMSALKEELRSRPEPCIALVTHRDVIESLVGLRPANCEFRTLHL